MKKFTIFMTMVFFVFLANKKLQAQCKSDKDIPYTFNVSAGLKITACIHPYGLGFQSVSWGVKNNIDDELEVKFVKVYNLNNGKVVKKNATILLNPKEFIYGGNFVGDIELNDAFFKEDCPGEKKVRSLSYELLHIRNFSKEKRDKEAKELARKIEEEQKLEEERQKREEEQKKAEEQKRKEEERKRAEEQKRKEEERKRIEEQKKKEEAKKNDSSKNSKTESSSASTINSLSTYYVESQEDRLRRERVNEQQNKDNLEDMTMGTAAAAVVGGILLNENLNNDISYNFFTLKSDIGIGMQEIPIISNKNDQTSHSETSFHPTVFVNTRLVFFNNNGIQLHIIPQGSFGMNALTAGESGTHTSYGVTSQLEIGRRSKSTVKFFAEGGYIKRSGNWNYDLDAATASSLYTFPTNTNILKEASYNYSIIRYGGGLKINFSKYEDDFIMPAIYFENMSFLKNQKPTLVGGIRWMIGDGFNITGLYSRNYPAAGEPKYNINHERQVYFEIKISKHFNIIY